MIDDIRFHNMSYAEIGMEFEKLIAERDRLKEKLEELQRYADSLFNQVMHRD